MTGGLACRWSAFDGRMKSSPSMSRTQTRGSCLRAANAAACDLRMPCCGAAVVLRTSPLGTRHFAHARRGPCTSAPETAEHLLAKRVVVEGIKRTEWIAKIE